MEQEDTIINMIKKRSHSSQMFSALVEFGDWENVIRK